MVTALIIAGVIVAGTATAGICYSVKERKEKEANLEKEIKSYSNTVNSLTSLRTELTNTKNSFKAIYFPVCDFAAEKIEEKIIKLALNGAVIYLENSNFITVTRSENINHLEKLTN